MAAAMLVACEKDVVDEATSNVVREANALLQVTTRGTGDATISYPVQVYVFQGDDCKAVPTTAEASLMYDAREAIGNLSAGSYLCLGGTGYRAFKPTDAAFSTSSSNVKGSTVLRPVVTININKE